ncbi:GNAT family N-acetyltransferase [Salinilacihabitans rarus]|uniref:GNAT family N-acetyltransferase n=1 Tax=Salinilacihabitans rarus TaxID=2961596 RepID=UPI0020C867C7|nr:GNAT family N-acetyltransferase [Salinilacihabitans rarus]
MRVRDATSGEALDVRRILDAAMLEPGDVEARIAAGDVLVAVVGDRHLGALVLDPRERDRGAHVAAVAVRRRRRNRGVGTALVERALERERRLTARFDEDVRPFYESLGFSIEPIDDRRYRGVRRLDG